MQPTNETQAWSPQVIKKKKQKKHWNLWGIWIHNQISFQYEETLGPRESLLAGQTEKKQSATQQKIKKKKCGERFKTTCYGSNQSRWNGDLD